jgi:serpin B
MRRLKIAAGLTVALTVAFWATGCKAEVKVARADVERQADPPTDDMAALVADNSEFAFDLYRQLVSEHDGNLIFSPHSISTAFAMLYAGAQGETAAQTAETLHYSLPSDRLHAAFNALALALQPPDGDQTTTPNTASSNAADLTLSTANAVWGQDGLLFKDNYLQILGLNYGVGLNLADFDKNSESTRQTMSQWVSNATEGHINDVPPPGSITPQTRLAIVNAIYFKGAWTYPFSAGKTYDTAFHLIDGSEVSAPMMMNDLAHMRCGRGSNYYGVELTYGASESAAMLFLIPDAGQFQDFEGALGARFFQDIRIGLVFTNGLTFNLPRFKFDSDVDLYAAFSAMGLTLPFSQGADFTGISSSEILFIDYAAHKATISVDEKGTEASGATFISMAQNLMIGECDSQVIADRPFIFAIYDQETSALLFLGRVMNPAV